MTQRMAHDARANLALAGIAATVVLTVLLRAAGTLAAAVTGHAQPSAGITTSLAVLRDPLAPGDALNAPGLHGVAYWASAAVLLAVVAVGACWIYTATGSRTGSADPRRLPGTATRRDVTRAASSKALMNRARTLRPSLRRPRPHDVGYMLGTAHGRSIWASVEDSMLLLGPPRSGKGLHVVINNILDSPGAVITTSTRPDALTVTYNARQRRGVVAVFDPQQLAPGLPAGLRWSPIRGCDNALTAMIRATALASGTDYGSVSGGDFWEGKTRVAIQCLLHAAALDHRDASTLYQWALNPTLANDAARILHAEPRAATGWADSLDAMLQSDPRTRDSIWHGVSLAFACLGDPRVLDAVTPRASDETFDPERFLRENGTLYLLATGSGAGASAALVAAFIEDLTETARRLAARSPGARLDPPLALILDEVGNLAPLPSLPVVMAEGGGSGISVMPVLQSLAQARDRWGEHAANAIWDSGIVKIILGGSSNSRDLQDLSSLLGERDDPTDSVTTDTQGGRSTQRSIRRVPVLPPDVIRTLPFGTDIVLLRSTRPIVSTLRPWTTRPDADQLRADRAEIEEILRHSH